MLDLLVGLNDSNDCKMLENVIDNKRARLIDDEQTVKLLLSISLLNYYFVIHLIISLFI